MQEASRDVVKRTSELLEEQATIYGALLDLSRRKQRVLAQGSLDELERITRAEEALLWQAGRLEERRTSVQEELALDLHQEPGAASLAELLERLRDEERERCSGLCDRLREVSAELQAVNELNMRLIQQALSYVNFSLQALARLGGGQATYAATGGAGGDDVRARRLFDRRA